MSSYNFNTAKMALLLPLYPFTSFETRETFKQEKERPEEQLQIGRLHKSAELKIVETAILLS